MTEGERLSKRMAALGLASRREADEWIAAGWVRVNGRLAVLGLRIGPDAKIEIDPRARREQAQRMTVLLHKPIGYVSGQAEDGYEPAVTLVRAENRWSEDRSLAHTGRAARPRARRPARHRFDRPAGADAGRPHRAHADRRRLAHREGVPGARAPPAARAVAHASPEDLARLHHGLALDGQPLKPAKVSWANEDQLRFVLREGKKRQIRRMCELVGLEVTGLKRVRIGSVVLGKLPLGQWRYLRPDESF